MAIVVGVVNLEVGDLGLVGFAHLQSTRFVWVGLDLYVARYLLYYGLV